VARFAIESCSRFGTDLFELEKVLERGDKLENVNKGPLLLPTFPIYK